MPDWFWISLSGGLACAAVYFWRKSAVSSEAARVTRAAVEARTASAPAVPESVPASTPKAEPLALPRVDYEQDDDVEPTKVGPASTSKPAVQPPTKRIVYDDDAADDEPTKATPLILVTATAKTDRGKRRKRNEDNMLVLPKEGVFVVADGMGGYNGGEIASEIAVKTIEDAFASRAFAGQPHETLPRRASELARAVQMANDAILARAETEKNLNGMGTTICAARFTPNKLRAYVAHVGDSRMYRLRGGDLTQVTSDHTMRDLGVVGETSAHLSRAVGVWPTVPIDVVLLKPQFGDIYLLCSDGLTKMVTDDLIKQALANGRAPSDMVEQLVDAANDAGGKDNVTIVVVRVDRASGDTAAAAPPGSSLPTA